MKTSLQAAQAEVEAKAAALEELQLAKAKAEDELAAIRATLDTLQSGQSDDTSKLQAVYAEVCASRPCGVTYAH